MLLTIHDNLRISDVKDHFSKCFPQLTLAFYFRPHKKDAITSREENISGDQLIGDVRKKGVSGQMRVLSTMTVREFENRMENEFGLYVNVMIDDQITSEDHFSLRQLCDMGVVGRET